MSSGLSTKNWPSYLGWVVLYFPLSSAGMNAGGWKQPQIYPANMIENRKIISDVNVRFIPVFGMTLPFTVYPF